MKVIVLTLGKVALVDDADYESLCLHRWHTFKRPDERTFYAARSITLPTGNRSKIFMHREIMGIPGFIDHRDLDGLNNQRDNLRAATPGENCRNIGKPRHGVTSRYKGVCWHPKAKKYQATIRFERKNHYLGLFLDQADAGWAYDRAARNLFGAFARCNFAPPPMVIPEGRGIDGSAIYRYRLHEVQG